MLWGVCADRRCFHLPRRRRLPVHLDLCRRPLLRVPVGVLKSQPLSPSTYRPKHVLEPHHTTQCFSLVAASSKWHGALIAWCCANADGLQSKGGKGSLPGSTWVRLCSACAACCSRTNFSFCSSSHFACAAFAFV